MATRLLFVTPSGECAVAFEESYALSSRHGNMQLAAGSVLRLRNVILGTEYEVTVVAADEQHDFIIFRAAAGNLTELRCELRQGRLGDDCYQVGLSVLEAPTLREKIYIDKGVLSSCHVDARGHTLASPGSNRGDSGGGCFSNLEGSPVTLFGLVVGNRNIPIHQETRISDLCFPSRTVIVPASTIRAVMNRIGAAGMRMVAFASVEEQVLQPETTSVGAMNEHDVDVARDSITQPTEHQPPQAMAKFHMAQNMALVLVDLKRKRDDEFDGKHD